MKIQNMELFKVPPRWLFLKLTTDDGIVGWGEPIVEGKADAVRACVEELKDQLLGREAGNIEELWQTMYRCNFYRGGPVLTSAMSGIEQALWDVKGRRWVCQCMNCWAARYVTSCACTPGSWPRATQTTWPKLNSGSIRAMTLSKCVSLTRWAG